MYCIVVKRGGFEHYELLHKAFGQRAPVMWDRRHAVERRRACRSLEIRNRRRAARRGREPASWMALGFVVVSR